MNLSSEIRTSKLIKKTLCVLFTVICPPTDMTAVTTCSNSDIIVSWNLSPETGAQYFIHSLKEGGAAANYTTPQPYHLISGLHCAELYTFKVAAMNSQCSSIFSEQIQAETGPYLDV
ncbi:hypothetical protein ILYODFUR_013138 [Ilyodon furcidens]|uniref:Fibronectin type-III domain-containing protein n=1 Tax=Ilyodon furcidens TaxID=33524 RepID=A0ABV0T7M9_9TELE